MKKFLNFKFFFFSFGAVAVVLLWRSGSLNFEVKNSGENSNLAANISNDAGTDERKNEAKTILKGSLSGFECENKSRRPYAVMLAGDPRARPLSGISEADIVVEMPVTPSINRFMAVYQCREPKEIGSVRSARHDFIPLAAGFDAIYSHWGGSHFALDKLNNGIIDNIDALKNPFGAFFRKPEITAPDNGFSSDSRLFQAARKLEYRQESEFEGYWRTEDKSFSDKKGILEIGYSGAYAVRYEYFPASNAYLRWKDGKPEIDKNSNTQAAAKNVAAMFAAARLLEDQYNDVDVEGEGKALVYRNGEEIAGKWKKDGKNIKSKLYFYGADGEEISFAPGSIWIEIVSPETEVAWKFAE